MKKMIAVFAALLVTASTAYADDVSENITVKVNGNTIAFEDQQPVILNDRTLLPVRGVMEAMGKEVSWDEVSNRAVITDGAVTVSLGIGDSVMVRETGDVKEEITLDSVPVIINDRTMLPVRAVAESFGATVSWDSETRTVEIFDGEYEMPETVCGDDYRYNGNIEAYPPMYVLDRSYVFESVEISRTNGELYAAIVNDIADKLPGVNVYNMLVPDSTEFYAPKQYYTNQIESFQHIYDKLDSNVTSVDISQALYSHAGESIYFRTDHHWTQRGAYYAWRAFMEQKGEAVPDLSEFDNDPYYEFTGSFVSYLDGALNSPYETMERFVPQYDAKVKIYNDMYMTDYVASLPLVDVSVGDYSCFIGTDSPVAVIGGGVTNGKSIAIIKESVGNALATWAVNNYETVYVIDIRGFYDGGFDIAAFHVLTGFEDLLIESYPTTVESSDLRIGLLMLLE